MIDDGWLFFFFWIDADLRVQYLMVDIVVNHNGWNGPPDSVDYSKFNPFNKKEYYNTPYCEIDYNDLGDEVSNA
jgi:hypothetical protein